MAQQADEERPAGQPTLSVVVPIYNVDAYLDECLESVSAQAVQDIEVIMVDDGSTDRSGEIAARWTARDGRYRLVRQENSGLGHARNTGVAHVTGSYLAFLDSDDRVGEDAYRRMIDTLEVTGSDFATGNVHRFDSSGRTWQAPLYRGMAKVEERATHVSRNHELLRDHLAHNKVWRTSFWRESQLQFPVGVLYEDVPTTIPAHVRARAVDVVPVVAVVWRVRDQGDSSITQNRHQDASHLRDRVDGALTASRFIAEQASQELKDAYDALVLRRDLRWYVDLYPEVDSAYQDEMFSSIGRYLAQISPEALRRTPVAMRIAYALLERGSREDFAAYVGLRRADKVGELPVSVRNGRAIMELQLPHGSTLPDEVCDVTDELRVVSRTSHLDVTDTHLVIEGWAFASRLASDELQHVRVWLDGDGQAVPGELIYRRDLRAAADAGGPLEATGRVAFKAKVPLRKLQRRWRRGGATWTVMVSVTIADLTFAASLANPQIGPPERPLMAELRGGQWLRVCWTSDGLTCRVRTEAALLTDVHVDGDAFVFTIRTNAPARSGSVFRLRSAGSEGPRDYSVTRDSRDKMLAHVRVSMADLPEVAGDLADPAQTKIAWSLFYRPSKAGRWQRVLDSIGLEGWVVTVGTTEYSVRRSRAATVDLARGPVRPALTRAEWKDGATLAVEMVYGGRDPVEAVILKAQQRNEYVSAPPAGSDGLVTAELPIDALPRFGETIPLRAGTWDLEVRTSAGDLPVRVGPGLLDELPPAVTVARRRYSVTDRRRHIVSVVIETDLDSKERGPRNQRRLRTEVYPRAKTDLRDVVLYESYYGKQFSDSPREVFAELRRRDPGLEHLIVVRDQQFNVPAGATAVTYRSEQYYEALAQARYVVANTHLPSCFRRADGQVVLQTWHGVGTKKIGLDMDAVHFANKTYIDNIRRGESDNWDYLVSANPFTSPILRRAFAYHGKLLETGVPRNDVFHRPDSAQLAATVKERLGIAPGTKVVMYAPTWRDNVFDGPGRYRLDLRFDLYEAARKLGDDYAIVFRRHSNIVDRLPAGHGAVVDASDYPDVQELLLVTDILVSDYSTLMCDFANTGRPMIFYTYDLANYRDVLRGFYFDFESEVPGPLITEEAELVPAILDAHKIRVEYDTTYQKFVERFCPWDDGHATTRVVDAIFGESV